MTWLQGSRLSVQVVQIVWQGFVQQNRLRNRRWNRFSRHGSHSLQVVNWHVSVLQVVVSQVEHVEHELNKRRNRLSNGLPSQAWQDWHVEAVHVGQVVLWQLEQVCDEQALLTQDVL